MLNNFVKTQIYQMARRTGTVLTEQHMRILEFTSDYYEKTKSGLCIVTRNATPVPQRRISRNSFPTA